MVTIKLDGIEATALDAVARYEGITPEHLLRDLIRDAAIFVMTGHPRRKPGDVTLSGMPKENKREKANVTDYQPKTIPNINA